jgi:hypothetical protein
MSSRKTTATTASDCSGKWKSWVGGNEEAEFNLSVSSGSITGDHGGKQILGGECEEPSGEPHHITLRREADAENIYEYKGRITPFGGGIFKVLPGDGKRKLKPKTKPAEEKTHGKDKFVDPEEWTAEKGT